MLAKLVNKSDDYGWGQGYKEAEADILQIDELGKLIIEKYPESILQAIFKKEKADRWFKRLNVLFEHIQRLLDLEK